MCSGKSISASMINYGSKIEQYIRKKGINDQISKVMIYSKAEKK